MSAATINNDPHSNLYHVTRTIGDTLHKTVKNAGELLDPKVLSRSILHCVYGC